MKTKKIILPAMLSLFAGSVPAQDKTEPVTFGAGAFSITTLTDVQQEGNANMLIGATDEMLNRYLPGGVYRSAINAFLAEADGRTVLVDAGLGRNLTGNLEKCGKKAEDIQIILLTHLHGDHIGGLLQDGKKAFPRAALYLAQAEYDYWTSDEAMMRLPENRRNGFAGARKMLDAYRDSLHLFVPGEPDGTARELLPGIRAIAAYGHTPGHTAYLLDSDGYRLLIWGDVTHVTPIQIPCPQVAVSFDVDPAAAIASRRRIMACVAEKGIRVAGMHIEYPGLVDIRGDASAGYSYKLLCVCEGSFR
ncbi:MAG: MBL fold metallo-hydrolase [Tannerella sp.]|jgi:glyoxylase-like metal-dependent hydrolase (beta-lactamase superfamily II)|nr:MBL fold metallo-hydrolase [Tannerella sp.]